VSRWRRDADATRRLLFLQIAASAPLLRADEDRAESLDRYGCADCWYDGARGTGLRAAWASGEIAVSLDTHERWRQPELHVDVEVLDERGAVVKHAAVVRHLVTAAQVEVHRPWLKERQLRDVRDGRDVWERRRELFPSVDFCREVERQLSSFDAGSDALRNILRRLLELDAAFARWTGTPLEADFLLSKCSPETPQTLAEEAQDHTATRADGHRKLFKWHARFTPGAGRIFFDGDAVSGRGLVGYVGVKKDGKLT
jgi:hypothetical protein